MCLQYFHVCLKFDFYCIVIYSSLKKAHCLYCQIEKYDCYDGFNGGLCCADCSDFYSSFSVTLPLDLSHEALTECAYIESVK